MLFSNRLHCIAEVETAKELAEKLTQFDWTSCQAFLLGEVLYANDSTGPDGAQEYGVIEVRSRTGEAVEGIQFESVTFGWIEEPRALELIESYADPEERKRLMGPGEDSEDEAVGEAMNLAVRLPLHRPGESCSHCA